MTPSVSDGRPITKYFSVSTSNHRASRQTTVVSFRRLDVVMENLLKLVVNNKEQPIEIYSLWSDVCKDRERGKREEKRSSVVSREHTTEIEIGN